VLWIPDLELFGQFGSGSDHFVIKMCIIFVNWYYKVVQFVFDYIHVSVENLNNASKVLLQSIDIHLKFANYRTYLA
jgi:hypothetical protein